MADELNLDEMQARCDAATKGPWTFTREATTEENDIPCWVLESALGLPDVLCRYWATSFVGAKDAAFIAHARTDIPALIAEVRRLRREAQPHGG